MKTAKAFTLTVLITFLLCTITIAYANPITITPEEITGTDDIHFEGSTLKFTENITDATITIDASNITVDGRAYTLQNTSITLANAINVTFTNMIFNDTGTKDAITLMNSSKITVTNSTISGAQTAIAIAGGTENQIIACTLTGNSKDLTVTNMIEETLTATSLTCYLNNFMDANNVETALISGGTVEPIIAFSNGTHGNHWLDYNGVDANIDGIGDTPYNITETIRDHYPLMTQYPTTVIPEFPTWSIPLITLAATSICIIIRKRMEVH